MLNRWKYGILAAGFSGIAGQILILRGLETTFGGNELSLAVFFTSWLIWSGLGVLAGKHLSDKSFCILLAIQGCFLFPDLILIKSYSLLVNLETGVTPSIKQMVSGGFLLTAPYAFITGTLFTTGIKVSGSLPGKIYAFEALGAGLAGFATALLLGNMSAFQIAGIIFILNITIALGRILTSIFSITSGLFIILYLSPVIDELIINKKYPEFKIISQVESKYGDIVITERNELNSVYINGQLNSSYPNPYLAEESVHFPLLTYANPQKVLLIGGGFSGTLQEILKHPSVNKIYYAEIDAKLTEVILENFPQEAVAEYYNSEVQVINSDGRAWLKNSDIKFDVIITALPPPSTALLNRYYTEEFFRETKNSMNPAGVFGFIMESSEDFIDESLAEYLAGLRNTMQEVFSNTVVLPGYNACFLGSSSEIEASLDSLITRISERELDNEFISLNYLQHRLSKELFNYLDQSISNANISWVNRDFFPKAYLTYLVRWERQFHPHGKSILNVSGRKGVIFSLTLVVLTIFFIVLSGRKRGFVKSVKTAVFTTGFAQIGMQLIILLGFQSIYGYLYYQQALLIAAFMVGAAGGSWFAPKLFNQKSEILKKNLMIIQSVLIFLPLLIMFILFVLQNSSDWLKHVLTLTALFSGCIGGIQYCMATNYIRGNPVSVGGNLYAFDLSGAAFGALIIGLILMPAAGFLFSALILSAISFIPAGFMIFFRRD